MVRRLGHSPVPFIDRSVEAANMNWQVVKYRHPMLFVRLPEGDIYQLKVKEDGTIEQDSSCFDLSDRRRDAIAYLSRYRRWFGHWIPIQNES